MHSPSLHIASDALRLVIPGRRKPVTCVGLADASTRYLFLARGRRNRMPISELHRLDGSIVGYLSPNGKIWSSDPRSRDWMPGGTPLYDPSAPAEPASDAISYVSDWYRARTEQAIRAQGWTPETTLFADYERYCEGTEIPAEHWFDRPTFAAALHDECGRAPERRLVEVDGSHAERYEPCWPRALIRPIRVAA